MDPTRTIRVRGARQHNLKNIHLDLPRDRLIVFTGLSGSGKSSLAFDTIYAEGQRRYVESLSVYARQFLEQLEKPDVDYIEGLPPTVAIEQKQPAPNPRSTVATTTEIHDYLRLLFARVGEAHCPVCDGPLRQETRDAIVDRLLNRPEGKRFILLGPVVSGLKGDHRQTLERLRAEGFVRLRVDGAMYEAGQVPPLDPGAQHTIEAVVDRLVVKAGVRPRTAESLEAALKLGDGLAIAAIEQPRVNEVTKKIEPGYVDHLLSDRYACPSCKTAFPALAPRLFSFNSPEGACAACDGLGTRPELDPELVIPDPDLALSQGAIEAWRLGGKKLTGHYDRLLADVAEKLKVRLDVPWKNLPADTRRMLLGGTSPADAEARGHFFEGIIPNLKTRYEKTESPQVKARIHEFMSEQPCPSCAGTRLKRSALSVRVADRTIADLTRLGVSEAHAFFSGLRFTGEREQIAGRILKGIRDRLHFLVEVGVGYLGLDRETATLSGGEAQRIRLATQVGSGLAGVCYVLDEPTIGLHQRDNQRLLDTLVRLRDAGNTVIVVEHDEQTIRLADHVVDMGPGAGTAGGEVVAQGTLAEVLATEGSLTAAYLKRELEVAPASRRRKLGKKHVEVIGARAHNLQGIDVKFPLGGIVCVTGVSGSGKSTLVRDVLHKALARRTDRSRGKAGAHERIVGADHIERVVEIDQSPIGRSPRSNPATFSGVFNPIRRVFEQLQESRVRGYDQSRFSFNVKGGRCEACQGQGEKRIEMHFLPDVFVRCEQCRGKKYDREILEVKLRGLSIADVLDLTVEAARRFFKAFPRIREPLRTLEDVGLGYLTLGQSSTTLSGGEAQRLKLAAELSRPSGEASGHALFVLDEPTTGLHFADISRLMDILNRLADMGHTLVVIEHNLDVIRAADWIIDLGPEGGSGGGRVVCEGTPEEVAKHPVSHTGRFLREALASVAAPALQ